jgi:hypothetical protein
MASRGDGTPGGLSGTRWHLRMLIQADLGHRDVAELYAANDGLKPDLLAYWPRESYIIDTLTGLITGPIARLSLCERRYAT